jgi:hypothetical protein
VTSRFQIYSVNVPKDGVLVALKPEIPFLMELQNSRDPDVRQTARSLLEKLTEYDISQRQVTSVSQDGSQEQLSPEIPSRRIVVRRFTRSLLSVWSPHFSCVQLICL